MLTVVTPIVAAPRRKLNEKKNRIAVAADFFIFFAEKRLFYFGRFPIRQGPPEFTPPPPADVFSVGLETRRPRRPPFSVLYQQL
jgi:hypothetical protein